MAKYRNHLPQLSDKLFLTDGGLETTLIYLDGIELPFFAAFDLMRTDEGRGRIRAYYARYAAIARDAGLGFVLESPTWRANPDWATKMGIPARELDALNARAIELMSAIRRDFETAASPMVISGCLGPRGDGYEPGRMMKPDEARAYHAQQVEVFAAGEADMVSAFTMTYAEEAVGIALAAGAAGMPVAISFTLETDGRLPTGQALKDAIEQVDGETGGAPAYYMINCAHPTHFEPALGDTPWMGRIRGLRANASKRSHAELDRSTDLDAGDPVELGRHYGALRRRFGHMNVLGGCCGTDHRHVEQIRLACAPATGVRAA